MRLIQTDDSARLLEFRVDFWGYQVRIPMLALGVVAVIVAVFVAVVVTAPVGDLLGLSPLGYFFVGVVIAGVLSALLLSRGVRPLGRLVTNETPVRYLTEVLVNELTAARPDMAEPTTLNLDIEWVEEKDRKSREVVHLALPTVRG